MHTILLYLKLKSARRALHFDDVFDNLERKAVRKIISDRDRKVYARGCLLKMIP